MSSRRLGVLLALLLLSHPAAAEVALRDWADGLAQPELGGAGVPIRGRRLVYGSLELVLADGRWAPVHAGGRTVGAFFTGSGSFRYAVEDPILDATWQTNVKQATNYEVDACGAIGDSLHTLLLLLSGGAESLMVNLPAMDDEPPAESALATIFRKHLERRVLDLGGRFESLLPQAMREPPATPVVVVEIGAEKHDLLYVRDSLRDEAETLAVMRPRDGRGVKVRDPIPLCRRPLRRPWLQPGPLRFRLVDLDVTFENPGGERAELTIRETLAIQRPLHTLEFLLRSSMVEEDGVGRQTRRPYEVLSIGDAAGNALPFLHRYGELVVELPEQLPAGARVELVYRLAGDVLLRPQHDNYWLLEDGWYPSPWRRDMEAFTYHAVIKVREPFVPFTCGHTERRWQEADLVCAEFREPQAIQGVVLLAGKYSTYSVEHEGLTLSVSTYAMRDEEKMKQIAGLALALIQYYRPLMGDFPFRELNILEINDFGFGLAPAGNVFITREAFARIPLEGFAGLFVEGINRRLAHEIAHAWWGHVAMLAAAEDEWLSESVAEYYSAFALGQMKGKEEFDAAFRDWKRGAKAVEGKGSVYLANYISGEEATDRRIALLYGKGPLMLHALRREVGDNTFFTILKSYLRSFHFRYATTKDFIGITQFITKQDHTAFFDLYLFGSKKIDVKK